MTTIHAESRDGQTKSEIKQLRAQGKVPGVVYGKEMGSTNILIDEKELKMLLKGRKNPIVELEIPGVGTRPVMLTEMQRDSLNRSILHIDFHQIRMDQKVKAVVRIEFTGDAAGENEGGIFQTIRSEVEVKCLPNAIPASFKVDVSGLQVGDNLLVSDIPAVADVTMMTGADEVIATVLAPQKAEPEEAAEQIEEAKATGSAAEESAKEKEAVEG